MPNNSNGAPLVEELDDDYDADAAGVSKSLVVSSTDTSVVQLYEKHYRQMNKQNEIHTQQIAIKDKQINATLAVVTKDQEQMDKLLQSNQKKDDQIANLTQALLQQRASSSSTGVSSSNISQKRSRPRDPTSLTADQKKLRLLKLKRNELIEKVKGSGITDVDKDGNPYDYTTFDGLFHDGKRFTKEDLITLLSQHSVLD